MPGPPRLLFRLTAQEVILWPEPIVARTLRLSDCALDPAATPSSVRAPKITSPAAHQTGTIAALLNGRGQCDAPNESELGARARTVDRGEGAVRSAHEAVTHIVGVDVPSDNCPLRIQAALGDHGALVYACARTRSIEGGEG